ncbi:MAG: hypothetical protein Q7R50_01940 [Dehalococcoidales bacterium]|nr:hypothetical protein [Dehalococcoidales bacterium]
MITYYYLNQKYSDHAKVDWNYAVGRVQIDVIVKTKNTLIFIECKHTDKIIDEAKELIPSVSNICKLPQFKKDWEAEGHLRKKLIMSVWKKPSNKVLKELKKLNVGVLIMSEIFNKQFSNKNQDKKLNHLFERNPNAPDDFEDDDIDWDSVPFA